MASQLHKIRPTSLWYSLPEEMMGMIADQFLDLGESQKQEECAEYPRAASLDMNFAQIDRKARGAFVQTLGERQVMMHVSYHRGPNEFHPIINQIRRDLSNCLPKSRFQHLCKLHNNFSILRVDLGSVFPTEDTICEYTSIVPATPLNALMLASFIQDYVRKLPAIGVMPRAFTKQHKYTMTQLIHDFSSIARNIKCPIAVNPGVMVPRGIQQNTNPGSQPINFSTEDIETLQVYLDRTKKTVQTSDELIAMYLPYQSFLQDLITNDQTPIRSLLPIIITLLSGWEKIITPLTYNFRQISQGTSIFRLASNFASILMRSLADFLLTQPNTIENATHYILNPGKRKVNKARPNPTFLPNKHFEDLTKCMYFANGEFVSLRRRLRQDQISIQQPQLTPHELAQRLAVVQDEAHLELALARYKTLPGMMWRYKYLDCECEDKEKCAYMDGLPREHLDRAKRRAILVETYMEKMERYRVDPGWITRWMEAFKSVAEKIDFALEGKWQESDGILVKPVTDFDKVEFAFQYALEDE